MRVHIFFLLVFRLLLSSHSIWGSSLPDIEKAYLAKTVQYTLDNYLYKNPKRKHTENCK